jgi:hypothetical protein
MDRVIGGVTADNWKPGRYLRRPAENALRDGCVGDDSLCAPRVAFQVRDHWKPADEGEVVLTRCHA